MNVIGYDLVFFFEVVWCFLGDKMFWVDDLDEFFVLADYIIIYVSYIKGVIYYLIDVKFLVKCKLGVNLFNFVCGEIIDGFVVCVGYDVGKFMGKYVFDFLDLDLMGYSRYIVFSYLGVLIEEVEENFVVMVVDMMMDFFEIGMICNLVNFFIIILLFYKNFFGVRFCIVNKNEFGVFGEIIIFFGM